MKQQIDDFPGSKYHAFTDRNFAMDYLRMSGIPIDNIRLFQKTFRMQTNFIPDPHASFKQEFGRLASSQQWSDQHARKARVDAMRDEIIKHCLPDGIRIGIEQDDDEGCRSRRRSVLGSIPGDVSQSWQDCASRHRLLPRRTQAQAIREHTGLL